MLQQTQVATVIPYYQRFLARFPTIEALAAAGEDEVLAAWAGLGYYSRARSLHRAAREALARHGALPGTLEELRRLPGFGPYTAGAVASIAFGVPAAAVDGNVGRVLSRVFLLDDEPHGRAFRSRVESLAGRLVGAGGTGSREVTRRPGDLNQALIELGALLCRPGVPRCDRCPLEPLCSGRRSGLERDLPRARRRPVRRRLDLAVGVCTLGGRVLLVRRQAVGLFGGMWAPPSVELPADGRAAAGSAGAISSAIRRELSVKTGEFTARGVVERTLTHRELALHVFSAELREPPAKEGGWRLVEAGEVESLAVPQAMRLALRLGVGAAGGGGGPEKNRRRGIGTRNEKG